MKGNLTGLYIGHAWSYDGLTWSDQYLGSVTTTVYFDDHSNVTFSYRERPDITLTDGASIPITFASGMTGLDGYGDSFSFVQSICSSSQRLCYGEDNPPTENPYYEASSMPDTTAESIQLSDQ